MCSPYAVDAPSRRSRRRARPSRRAGPNRRSTTPTEDGPAAAAGDPHRRMPWKESNGHYASSAVTRRPPQSRQQLEIFCGAVYPATSLGPLGKVIGNLARLDALGGLDRPRAIHQRRQLGTGRLGHSREVRQCGKRVVGHCTPPACRKLSAVATSPSPGDVRPAKSASVHATAKAPRSQILVPTALRKVDWFNPSIAHRCLCRPEAVFELSRRACTTYARHR